MPLKIIYIKIIYKKNYKAQRAKNDIQKKLQGTKGQKLYIKKITRHKRSKIIYIKIIYKKNYKAQKPKNYIYINNI